MRLCNIFVLFAVGLSLFACNDQKDPQSVLLKYIDYRFAANQTKDELLKMTTGNLYQSITMMTDEDFEQFKKVDSRRKKAVNIRLANCSAERCSITYVISYQELQNEQTVVEAKKIATLEKVDGNWKLSDVDNVKTYINAQTPIDIGL